jgi:hypothetical protein
LEELGIKPILEKKERDGILTAVSILHLMADTLAF